jgi:hypothetical protein
MNLNFNKGLIFLCISLCIFIFSLISTFTAPFINKINDNISNFSKWGKLNCKYYSDMEKDPDNVDEIQKMKKSKYLCYRQKAVYNLEHASFTINIILGFICAQLGLLVYFKIENSIEKIAGLFGLITGIICFILTFIYICFSCYIFNNDTAYKIASEDYASNPVVKLFSNGGSWRWIDSNTYVTPFEGDKSPDANYIKYKDLGKKQYNYYKKYYIASSTCTETYPQPLYNGISCEYSYPNIKSVSISNKYLYDNWVTTIIFAFFIIICDIGLGIFGFLLFKNKNESNIIIPTNEPIQISKK